MQSLQCLVTLTTDLRLQRTDFFKKKEKKNAFLQVNKFSHTKFKRLS